MATTELNVTNGTITVSPAGGATISAGANASSTLTLCGTQDAINATLATVSYQGNLNYNGSDSLTILSSDSTETPLTDSETVTLTVNPINDIPILTITGTATEDQTLTSNLTDKDGLGTVDYQWNRTGTPINGQTNST